MARRSLSECLLFLNSGHSRMRKSCRLRGPLLGILIRLDLLLLLERPTVTFCRAVKMIKRAAICES
jgi:hypothetical protein